MCSHLDALQAMGPVHFRRVARGSHSVPKQALFYIAFGTDLKGFWRPEWTPNFDFASFFSTMCFNAFEHRILVDFLRLPTSKIMVFPEGKQ